MPCFRLFGLCVCAAQEACTAHNGRMREIPSERCSLEEGAENKDAARRGTMTSLRSCLFAHQT